VETRRPVRWVAGAAWGIGALALLYVAGQPRVRSHLGPRQQEVARRLMSAELNAEDATQLQRGYYEQLMGVSRMNSQLWELYMKRPPEAEVIWQTQAGRRRDDFMYVELVPSQQILNGAAMLTTNRWGLRDRDYEYRKPARTYRIAITGASTTMGWSVGDEETFEHLTELRLERKPPATLAGRRVEILNFAVPGYTPPQFLGQLDRMLEFQPDMVLITTQDNDVRRTVGRLVDYQVGGVDLPFDSVQRLVAQVTAGAESELDAERRLRPHAVEVFRWFYGTIASRSRAAGAVPVFMYLPGLDRTPEAGDKETLIRAATEAGMAVLDLSGVYDGHEKSEITVAEYDFHPNPLGHQLVAQRLHRELTEHPELFEPGADGR
jgi:lysophospholipase L1-like esterase